MTKIEHLPIKAREKFIHKVGEQEARKLKAKRKTNQAIWFGLGMFGLIGWSIVIPTLIGIAIGVWLDRQHPGSHSWTLALLVAGLTLGCFNAWHWVTKEEREMQADDLAKENNKNDK